jgi:hypothetical protein
MLEAKLQEEVIALVKMVAATFFSTEQNISAL